MLSTRACTLVTHIYAPITHQRDRGAAGRVAKKRYTGESRKAHTTVTRSCPSYFALSHSHIPSAQAQQHREHRERRKGAEFRLPSRLNEMTESANDSQQAITFLLLLLPPALLVQLSAQPLCGQLGSVLRIPICHIPRIARCMSIHFFVCERE